MGLFIPPFTMQPTLIATVVAAALLTLAGTAQAQTNDLNTYVEVGYSRLTFKGDSGVKSSPVVIDTTLGYRFNPNVAVEATLGVGAGKDEMSYNGVGMGVQVKTGVNLGVFVRPGVELSDGVELFGRLGWQRTRATVSYDGISESESYNDFAYGLGVNVNLTKTSYLQASWMHRLSKDGGTVKGLGIAYGYRF